MQPTPSGGSCPVLAPTVVRSNTGWPITRIGPPAVDRCRCQDEQGVHQGAREFRNLRSARSPGVNSTPIVVLRRSDWRLPKLVLFIRLGARRYPSGYGCLEPPFSMEFPPTPLTSHQAREQPTMMTALTTCITISARTAGTVARGDSLRSSMTRKSGMNERNKAIAATT